MYSNKTENIYVENIDFLIDNLMDTKIFNHRIIFIFNKDKYNSTDNEVKAKSYYTYYYPDMVFSEPSIINISNNTFFMTYRILIPGIQIKNGQFIGKFLNSDSISSFNNLLLGNELNYSYFKYIDSMYTKLLKNKVTGNYGILPDIEPSYNVFNKNKLILQSAGYNNYETNYYTINNNDNNDNNDNKKINITPTYNNIEKLIKNITIEYTQDVNSIKNENNWIITKQSLPTYNINQNNIQTYLDQNLLMLECIGGACFNINDIGDYGLFYSDSILFKDNNSKRVNCTLFDTNNNSKIISYNGIIGHNIIKNTNIFHSCPINNSDKAFTTKNIDINTPYKSILEMDFDSTTITNKIIFKNERIVNPEVQGINENKISYWNCNNKIFITKILFNRNAQKEIYEHVFFEKKNLLSNNSPMGPTDIKRGNASIFGKLDKYYNSYVNILEIKLGTCGLEDQNNIIAIGTIKVNYKSIKYDCNHNQQLYKFYEKFGREIKNSQNKKLKFMFFYVFDKYSGNIKKISDAFIPIGQYNDSIPFVVNPQGFTIKKDKSVNKYDYIISYDEEYHTCNLMYITKEILDDIIQHDINFNPEDFNFLIYKSINSINKRNMEYKKN